jgi:hypothetical protein
MITLRAGSYSDDEYGDSATDSANANAPRENGIHGNRINEKRKRVAGAKAEHDAKGQSLPANI